jgi:hypothetical protein
LCSRKNAVWERRGRFITLNKLCNLSSPLMISNARETFQGKIGMTLAAKGATSAQSGSGYLGY